MWEVAVAAETTSATMTVPRTPTTALGVRTSTDSPGASFSRATASPIFPDSRLMYERPGLSVIVTTERSRTVTIDLPPSRTRASD